MAHRICRALQTSVRKQNASTHSTPLPKLAILDDYLNTSSSHFTNITSSRLQITTFNDTIVPVDEAETARLIERLHPFTLISTIRERTAFPSSLLHQLPNLKLLLATGTQFERFDLDAAKTLGITVVAAPGLGRTDHVGPQRPNIKKGNVHPTMQHTWALILALARNVAADDAIIKSGSGWQSRLATSLPGATIGVVGLGRLGAAVARVASLAFGMRVVCWSENLTQERADEMAVANGLSTLSESGEKTFRLVSKEELFQEADVVSLHYVLSERSRGIVGRKELELMKQEALLVNASRGPLIDGDALLEVLEKGGIRGVAMDVFDIEPLPSGSPWRRSGYWGRDGRSVVLTTPHMGYVDEGLMNTWYAETAENVERWLRGDEVLHRLN